MSRRFRRETSNPEPQAQCRAALRERFGVSERRACAVVGLHRSTMRSTPAPVTTEEAELRGLAPAVLYRSASLGVA